MSTQLLIAALAGTPIQSSSPARRVKTLARQVPALEPQSATTISVSFVPAADPGVVTSAQVLRGNAMSAEPGAKFYGVGNSIGVNVADNNLLARVWTFAGSTWAIAGGRDSFGECSYQPFMNIRSPLTISFETSATRIGVAFGAHGATVRLLVDRMDGGGWQNAAALNPALGGTKAGTVYFDFGNDGDPSALKRVLIETKQLFCGLVMHPNASIRPYDARRSMLKIATFGDSIGFVLARSASAIGGALQVSHGDGGTGYARPAASAIGGGSPTSNANIDPSTLLTSMSGNAGFNDGTLPEFQFTDRTDALIAAQPDMVIGAAGINDSTSTGFTGLYGWDVGRSVGKVWGRLRNGASSSVMVCCAPWTGAQRGVDGISGGERFVAVTIKSEFLALPGPSIFIDNRDSTWTVKRADGSIVNGNTGTGPWVTGIGMVYAPTGVGNADLYIGDGTHPGGWASTTLTDLVTLPAATLYVVAAAGGTSNFPPVGKLSIQVAGPVAYPGQVITYTGKTPTSFTGCTGGAGTFPTGSQVLMYDTTPGEDYYGNKVAAALCAALAVL